VCLGFWPVLGFGFCSYGEETWMATTSSYLSGMTVKTFSFETLRFFFSIVILSSYLIRFASLC
jgi:hypothetical protein